MAYVKQFPGERADAIFSLHTGSKYYAVIGSSRKSTEFHSIRDVTTPTSPKTVATRNGVENGISAWAKNEGAERLAIVSDGMVRVYDYSAFVSGSNAVTSLSPSGGKSFKDVAFDDDGRLWAVESGSTISNNVLWSLTPQGSGYTQQQYNVYGVPMSATIVDARNAPAIREKFIQQRAAGAGR
jgi:WD40 repeat protein